MKKGSIIFLFIFFLTTGSFYAQSSEVVYISIQEDVGLKRIKSLMTITYPNEKIEEIALVEIGFEGGEAKLNAMTIRNKLSLLINEGYTLQSSSVGANETMTVTVMVLIRKQQSK